MRCLACGTGFEGQESKRLDYENLEFPNSDIFNDLLITICPNCGLGFLNKEPSSAQVYDFYMNYYRHSNSPYSVDFSRMKPLRSMDARSLGQIYLGLSQINFNKNDIFLDLGPGSGNSFSTANLILDNPICYGIELNSGAQAYYLRAYGAETFQNISVFIEKGFKAKLIILSHSLEHFKSSEASKLMNELKMALSPDGAVVIEVPNDDLSYFGNLRINDSPHLLFFNRKSLICFVEKYGFKVVAFTKVGNKVKDLNHNFSVKKVESLLQIITRISTSRIYRLGIRIGLFLLRRFFRNYEIRRKPETHSFINQFTQSQDRDCLRLVIKLNAS
jgi:hypothetical protein